MSLRAALVGFFTLGGKPRPWLWFYYSSNVLVYFAASPLLTAFDAPWWVFFFGGLTAAIVCYLLANLWFMEAPVAPENPEPLRLPPGPQIFRTFTFGQFKALLCTHALIERGLLNNGQYHCSVECVPDAEGQPSFKVEIVLPKPESEVEP